MSFVVVQALTGLANAASLFLVASGLSLIFGVTRIVNFAHGSFYMLGAYVAWSTAAGVMALAGDSLGLGGFVLSALAAALAVGILGVAVEATVLRRLYRAPELMPLVATFGVVLILQDLTLDIWGPEDRLGQRPPALTGAVLILGERLPVYDLVLIAVALLALAGLWLLVHRTRFGILIRAATEDRDMAGALGIDERRLFTAVFFVGAALAGLGGALQLQREPANLAMDFAIIADAFVVVVIGGMGSIVGAFAASLLVAELRAFGIVIFPEITLVLLFLVMAVVLVVRPSGLFGRTESHAAEHAAAAPAIAEGDLVARWRWIGGIALAALAIALPFVTGDYGLRVASEILIFAVFAASLFLLLGVAGMISFGHAAYFGLGAYAAALLVHHGGVGMELALFAAPLAAAAGGLVFGWFCVRLSGVYLAMLTLACAQILWSAAHQWYAVTGGDNGIVGVWPAPWAASAEVYYGLTLAMTAATLWAIHRVARSPFGFSLRAGRDGQLRAEASGIDVRRLRWAAFGLAGAAAGLGGGLYAFLKGSVFPDVLSIPVSVDALVMLLLGGLDTVMGAILGASALTGLKIGLVSVTDEWRLVLGIVIIVVVTRFPDGVVTTAVRAAMARRDTPT